MRTEHYKSVLLAMLVFGMFAAAAGDGNWRGWPARGLDELKKTGEPIFVYLKDGASKNNAVKAAIKVIESDKILDQGDVQKQLPSMVGAKLNLNDKAIASYPADWLERAKKTGVLIVVASSDLTKLAFFDSENKNPQSISAACTMVQKYQNERKEEAADKRKKEEVARKEKFAEEVKKNKMNAVPGIEADAAPKKEKAAVEEE